jgi:hypothetical protein
MATTATQVRAQVPPTRWRATVQLSVTRAEYARMRRCARKEHLAFATWLVRLAIQETERKMTL